MPSHALPPLPYDYSALQPWISEQTMRIHHDAHHRACVDALNATEARLGSERHTLDFVLIRHLQRLVALHASEHFLHCLFWEVMGPNQGGQPRDELADQIGEDFGSFAAFKSQFCIAATSLDSGGWVVLAWQRGSEQLTLRTVERHQPQSECDIDTLLVLDVCEHAYYLQYQNRQVEYVHNWWNSVNWPQVARRFAVARHSGVHLVADRTPRYARLRSR